MTSSSSSDEFSENYYVREFLTYYAGFVANLTDGLEKEANENLKQLNFLDKKAKDILTTSIYKKFKKRKGDLIKSFNKKLILNLNDDKILAALDKAQLSLKKFNIQ
ncbi:MAG: hypothetical protein ACOX3T_04780 [Bdellovibrionota bacterium]